MEDVGDVGEHELEELVDRPRTANGMLFVVLFSIFLPFFCCDVDWSNGNYTRDLRRVERRRSSEAFTPSLQELCRFTIDFM